MRWIKVRQRELRIGLMILGLFLLWTVPIYATQSGSHVQEQGGAAKTTGWQQTGQTKYYYDENGKMQTGWQKIGGKWYYLDESGAMQTDWQEVRGKWYYLDESGVMQTGWQRVRRKWYYLSESGAMQTDWQEIGGKWYYLDESGVMQTGWQRVRGKWYYLSESGAMQTDWQAIGGKWYYLDESGAMQTDWQEVRGKWYYLDDTGAMASDTWIGQYYVDSSGAWIPERVRQAGWIKSGSRWWYQEADGSYPCSSWKLLSGSWYYFDKDGWMVTDWQKVGKATYYLSDSGAMVTGWLQIEKIWYYFSGSGAMQTGWQRVGGTWYYLDKDGKMQTGWQQIKGAWYYLDDSGAMVTGWQQVKGTWYYLSDSGAMVTGWQTIGGSKYYFDKSGAMASNTTVDGIWLNADGKAMEAAAGSKTVRGLLTTALLPVGQTMYIYGGGHDGSNGGDAVRIGVNPQWKEFYDLQDQTYDFTEYRYKHGYGLDCSGLVGWAVYNTLNTKPNQRDFSSTSTLMPEFLEGRGLGTYSVSSGVFTPGDVVSKSGHTWIVLGMCDDGSAVIIHSTPPVVQISGTVSAEGVYSSQAVKIAATYMKRYYTDTSSRFKLSTGDKSYLNQVNRFQWSSSVLSDPDGLHSLKAEEILKIIFGE